MSTSAAVAVHDLGISYGGTDVVRRMHLAVAPGERVGLIGPSGAGKTSVLNAIAGIVTPTEGSIELFGENPNAGARRAMRERAHRVGMVHQQLFLTPRLRVVHNVNAGRLATWSSVKSLWSLLRPVGVAQVAEVLTRVGIADKIHARTDSLSGGQQQRVALARVLLQQPDLFLADEPVSAVDPAWSRRVLEELTIDVRMRNASLLVVLHDVELAKQFCDRLIGMRNGEVVFDEATLNVSAQMIDHLYRFAMAV